MKIAAIILTFLVLTLSVLPDGCAMENYAKHTQKDKTQHTDDDCCVHCSPFYACGSCIGFIPVDYIIFNTITIENPVRSFSMAKRPAIRQIALTIWQPPRLNS